MLEFALGVTVGNRGQSRMSSLARSMEVGESSRHANLLEDMNDRLERQLVVMQAMWALMEEQGFDEDQLMSKIEEIQVENSDTGDARRLPAECPDCGSKVAVGLAKCQICGTEVGEDPGPLQI